MYIFVILCYGSCCWLKHCLLTGGGLGCPPCQKSKTTLPASHQSSKGRQQLWWGVYSTQAGPHPPTNNMHPHCWPTRNLCWFWLFIFMTIQVIRLLCCRAIVTQKSANCCSNICQGLPLRIKMLLHGLVIATHYNIPHRCTFIFWQLANCLLLFNEILNCK